MSTTKLFLAALLSATNLANAAPVESAVSSPETLGKRLEASSNCGLDMYQTVGQKAVMNNLFYLNSVNSDNLPPAIIWGTPGSCVMAACGGKVSFSLCVDKTDDGNKIPYEPSTLGHQLDSTFHDCYGGPPADSDTPIRAFQFWGKGYNLLAQGNADCSNFHPGS